MQISRAIGETILEGIGSEPRGADVTLFSFMLDGFDLKSWAVNAQNRAYCFPITKNRIEKWLPLNVGAKVRASRTKSVLISASLEFFFLEC